MKNFLLRLASAAVICTLSLVAQGSSQQTPRDTQQPSAAQQQDDAQAQEAKAFSGTIVKQKGQFVLQDTETKLSYQLDDQQQAKRFEGKQVKVMGKLDMNANMIHVENIESAS
jgi:hypothetical protein